MVYQFPSGVVIELGFIITGLLAAFIISYFSYKLRFLTKSGAASAFILGAIIFSFGQLKWSIPLISFFVFSSLLSKAGKKNKKIFNTVFEKSSQRDYAQVFANGGTGFIFFLVNLVYRNDVLYLAYVASFAAVSADTWATEIGTMKERVTYNILTLQKTKQGASGGISFEGTIGALLGAVIIALSALFWIHLNFIYYFCLIVFSGLTGSFIDSIIGASIQAQNRCTACGGITERKIHCGKRSVHFRGIKFVNNDLVNFIAAVSGSVIVLFIN